MSTVYDIFNRPRQAPPIQPQQPAYPIQNGINPGFFSQLQNFASALNGNPEQLVKSLLQSGRMTQEQFNQYSQQASQIQSMMRGF